MEKTYLRCFLATGNSNKVLMLNHETPPLALEENAEQECQPVFEPSHHPSLLLQDAPY